MTILKINQAIINLQIRVFERFNIPFCVSFKKLGSGAVTTQKRYKDKQVITVQYDLPFRFHAKI